MWTMSKGVWIVCQLFGGPSLSPIHVGIHKDLKLHSHMYTQMHWTLWFGGALEVSTKGRKFCLLGIACTRDQGVLSLCDAICLLCPSDGLYESASVCAQAFGCAFVCDTGPVFVSSIRRYPAITTQMVCNGSDPNSSLHPLYPELSTLSLLLSRSATGFEESGCQV